jgi:hypothetical protein
MLYKPINSDMILKFSSFEFSFKKTMAIQRFKKFQNIKSCELNNRGSERQQTHCRKSNDHFPKMYFSYYLWRINLSKNKATSKITLVFSPLLTSLNCFDNVKFDLKSIPRLFHTEFGLYNIT